MKRIIITGILLTVLLSTMSAQQDYRHIMEQIETNNTTLKAYRGKANADKIGNKTSLNLSNPEVEYGHAWGSPKAETDNETTLGITQTFDFPIAYKYRSELVNEQNKQVDLVYEQQRKDILLEASLICIDLIYRLKLNEGLKERVKYAEELLNSYQSMFDRGDINILERNKTKLNMLTIQKGLQMNEVEIDALKSELERMNGELSLSIPTITYPNDRLVASFDDWFAKINVNNPAIQIAQQEVTMSRKDEKLTRAMNLPKLSAGYTSEYAGKTTLHGFKVGISIPLWGGKNTVKHKKAQTLALEMEAIDMQLQFKNSLKLQYTKVQKMSVMLDEYDEVMHSTNTRQMLEKAFEKGQLPFIHYLQELDEYYSVIDKYYEIEKDYQLALAELMQWEI